MVPPTEQAGLKPQWFYILLALAGEDLHGSAIERQVLALSDGRVKLWPVTLYGNLDALSEQGLISELDEVDRPRGESVRKKYYRLTRAGRRVLKDEARHLQAVAGLTRSRLDAIG